MLIDVRHAVRSLKRGSGSLAASVLSLSLGIAATAVMLRVIDAIDVRPLPFGEPGALVDIAEVDASEPDRPGPVAPGVYEDWKARVRGLAFFAAASPIVASVQEGDGGLDAARVSPDFFSALQIEPALGRVISADDVRRQARVVVISYDLWQSRFGADAGAIGRTVPLSWAGEYRSVPAEPYVIAGVLPRGVRYPLGAQVWIPAAEGFGDSRRDASLTVIGRLARDGSLAAIRAEFEGISAQLSVDMPGDYRRRAAAVRPLRDAIRAAAQDRGAAARLPLLGVAAFILALAGLNVAALFLARTAEQTRELRTRLALGAPRARLATLLLTQSVATSFVAGLLGIVIAAWSLPFVSSRLQIVKSGMALTLDAGFVLSVLLLALVTGVLVATLPIWSLARLEERGVLGAASARGAGIASAGRVQKSLVIGQIGLAVTLLSGAGVLAAEFVRLVTSDTGFDPARLFVASLPISVSGNPAQAVEQARQVERRIGELAGLSAVALGAFPAEGYAYRLENGDTLRAGRSPTSYRVSPGYFATLRIRLNAGQEFQAADREGALPVGIVNRLAAGLWWPGQDPVGKRIYMARRNQTGEWVRIVGVVDNERVRRSMTSEIRPILYRPFDQLTGERRQIQLFGRGEHRPEAAFAAVGRVIEATYGGNVWRGERVTTMDSVLGASLAEQRFRASTLALFSAVALFLAAMGLYAIVATMVTQRAAEMGVRMALGARPARIRLLVFRQGAVLALAGFALGLAGSVAMTRIVQALLVNPAGFDIRMPFAIAAVLGAAVGLACYLPARRAARIDPARLLRDA